MKVYSQLERAQLENLGANPAAATEGRIWWRTDLDFVKVDTGASIITLVDAESTQTLSGAKSFSSTAGLTIAEIATPTTPASGFGTIYFKSDGNVYKKDDGGTETQLASAAYANNAVLFGTGTGTTVDASNFVWDDASNRLGIGTATPAKDLVISASAPTFRVNSTFDGVATNDQVLGVIDFYTNDASTNGTGIGASISHLSQDTLQASAVGSALTFATRNSTGPNASERMRIDKNGKIGIGTTSPARNLEIEATDAELALDKAAVANTAALYFYTAGTNNYSFGTNISGSGFADGKLQIYDHAASARLTMDTSGNFGFRTESPTAGIEIYRSSTTTESPFRVRKSSGKQWLGFNVDNNNEFTYLANNCYPDGSSGDKFGVTGSWANRIDMQGGAWILKSSSASGTADGAVTWNTYFSIDNSGIVTIGTGSATTHVLNTQTATTASAGAQTLPSNPQGFITISINGTTRKIPYYAN